MADKSFDKAFDELKQIVENMQSETVSIDKLSKELKRAAQLVNFCKERLREVESDISQISEEEVQD